MISVSEASRLVLSHLWSPSEVFVALADASGRVLSRDIYADRDLPPYNRVAMDGIAIRQAEFLNGVLEYQISGVIAAGDPPRVMEGSGVCMEVMTGAVLPVGADAVVRFEDCTIRDGRAVINITSIDPGMNIHAQGSDLRGGERLLTKGSVLSPAEIPMLASIGHSTVPVFAAPATAMISTGDELVAVNEQPLPHQIRRSNMAAVAAAMKPFGATCTEHHFGDNEFIDGKAHAAQKLQAILHEADLIIFSGGVSKGKFDWVPEALEAAGIHCVFHHVAQRPGKPLWFGTGNGKIVFALPGNPVSVFICLYRYVLPWLRASLGMKEPHLFASLSEDFRSEIPLTHFVQVRVTADDHLVATPVPGGGSGDFVNLRRADGFLEIPPRAGLLQKGMKFPYLPFRN